MAVRLLGLLIALVVVMLAVHAWLGGASGSKKSGGLIENITLADKSAAEANVRAAVPSLEAWYADHGTYEGATVEGLHRYDYGVRNIRIVRLTHDGYCLESQVGSAVASTTGPGGETVPAACSG
jgi:hypothetical protein